MTRIAFANVRCVSVFFMPPSFSVVFVLSIPKFGLNGLAFKRWPFDTCINGQQMIPWIAGEFQKKLGAFPIAVKIAKTDNVNGNVRMEMNRR